MTLEKLPRRIALWVMMSTDIENCATSDTEK
jgi:hypothetical protein